MGAKYFQTKSVTNAHVPAALDEAVEERKSCQTRRWWKMTGKSGQAMGLGHSKREGFAGVSADASFQFSQL